MALHHRVSCATRHGISLEEKFEKSTRRTDPAHFRSGQSGSYRLGAVIFLGHESRIYSTEAFENVTPRDIEECLIKARGGDEGN